MAEKQRGRVVKLLNTIEKFLIPAKTSMKLTLLRKCFEDGDFFDFAVFFGMLSNLPLRVMDVLIGKYTKSIIIFPLLHSQ
jgi:hypothetical protein